MAIISKLNLMHIKILLLAIFISLSSCGLFEEEEDSECLDARRQVEADLGEPDDMILYKGSDRSLSILDYIYYCEGITYTFHYGDIVDGCRVEVHTFTPICE